MVSNLFNSPFPLTYTSDTTNTYTHAHERVCAHAYTSPHMHTHIHIPFSFLLSSCYVLLYFRSLTTQVTVLGFWPGIHSRPMEPNVLHLSLLVIASPELNLRMYACQGEGQVARKCLYDSVVFKILSFSGPSLYSQRDSSIGSF